LAQQKGYNQVIWTDAATNTKVEESGTMNLMFVINGVLITPSLSPSKLAGITRDSVIELARHWGMLVQERDVSVSEIIGAFKAGTLQEAFGTGTAANIAHISVIGCRILFESRIEIPNRLKSRQSSRSVWLDF
jgi:branched-chain amino acid aminotransferase